MDLHHLWLNKYSFDSFIKGTTSSKNANEGFKFRISMGYVSNTISQKDYSSSQNPPSSWARDQNKLLFHPVK
jgi:hypothetical protein